MSGPLVLVIIGVPMVLMVALVVAGIVSQRRIEQAMMKWETARELPGFMLRPETVVDRLRGAVTGSRDISFPDDPALSQAYFLEGFNQGELRQLFGPDLRQYLVGKKGQNLAAKDRVLFWWRRGKLPPPDALDAFLAEGTEVSQRLLQ